MAEIRHATLGVRPYRVLGAEGRTALRDAYLRKIERQAGLLDLQPDDGDNNWSLTLRMTDRLVESGKAPDLIAGYLVPAGAGELDWTLDGALAVAASIRQCAGEEELAEINTLASLCVVNVFKKAIALQRVRPMSPLRRRLLPAAALLQRVATKIGGRNA